MTQTTAADFTQAHQQAMLRLLEEFDRVCAALDIPYVLFAGTMLGAVRHGGFIPWDDDLDVMLQRQDYERFLREAPRLLDEKTFFLQKEFSPHWPMFFSKLRLNGTTCLERFHPKDPQLHQGIYIDIFPCDSAMEHKFGRNVQFLASKAVIAKCLYARGYDTDSRRKKLMMQLCRLVPMKPMLRLVRMGRPDSAKVHTFFGGAKSYPHNVYPRQYFRNRVMMPFAGRMYPVPAEYDRVLRTLYGDYNRLPSLQQRQMKRHAILVDTQHSYERYAHYRDNMKFDVYTRSIR